MKCGNDYAQSRRIGSINELKFSLCFLQMFKNWHLYIHRPLDAPVPMLFSARLALRYGLQGPYHFLAVLCVLFYLLLMVRCDIEISNVVIVFSYNNNRFPNAQQSTQNYILPFVQILAADESFPPMECVLKYMGPKSHI